VKCSIKNVSSCLTSRVTDEIFCPVQVCTLYFEKYVGHQQHVMQPSTHEVGTSDTVCISVIHIGPTVDKKRDVFLLQVHVCGATSQFI